MISFWCRIEWPSLVNYFFCLTAKILVLNDVNTKQRDIILYQKKNTKQRVLYSQNGMKYEDYSPHKTRSQPKSKKKKNYL
jgi:hypothetical protein